MTVARTIRAIAVLGVAVGLSATPAGAAARPIGPHQHYVGLVNGKHAGAVIYVVCPGPASRTGPPVARQTVAVRRVSAGGGYTGSFAHDLWAQFGRDMMHVVRFSAYNVAKPIPTSLRLPCQGKGTVAFTTCFGTMACSADTRSDTVVVTFVNIAV
jgi:hypothetical protein